MDSQSNNPYQTPPRHLNHNTVQVVNHSKKDLKNKISSRQDFVILFGFERKLMSRLFFASQTLYYLALYKTGS